MADIDLIEHNILTGNAVIDHFWSAANRINVFILGHHHHHHIRLMSRLTVATNTS